MDRLLLAIGHLKLKDVKKFTSNADYSKDFIVYETDLKRLMFPDKEELSADDKEAIHACLKALDYNSDGVVSAQELVRFVLFFMITVKNSSAEPLSAYKFGVQRFKELDKDKSGTVEFGELCEYLHCETEEEKADVKNTFDTIDRNGNGSVSQVEFADYFATGISASMSATTGGHKRISNDCQINTSRRGLKTSVTEIVKKYIGGENQTIPRTFVYKLLKQIAGMDDNDVDSILEDFSVNAMSETVLTLDEVPCDLFIEYLFAVDDIPLRYTALNPLFPSFGDGEVQRISFNVTMEDVTDQSKVCPFCWQGAYCKLDAEGVPIDEAWREKLKDIASTAGAEKVQAYCKNLSLKGHQVFWSPAKARRWGAFFPSMRENIDVTYENLLIKEQDGRWQLVEVAPNNDTVQEHKLDKGLMKRLTYSYFEIESSDATFSGDSLYKDDAVSVPAWLDGATILLPRGLPAAAEPTTFSNSGRRVIHKIPQSFAAHRFVPFAKRSVFFEKVAAEAHISITGATLPKSSPFSSPLAKELAIAIGKQLGSCASAHGVRLMASASMQGHEFVMSADADFTNGFAEVTGCNAVHFKGSNMCLLHGQAWNIKHGMSYILEEKSDDFSNNAKEAALMLTASNPKSVALLAGGGPTVSLNLCRLLMSCSAHRVFTICGMHAESGTSGASGFFKKSGEDLQAAMRHLDGLVGAGGIFKKFGSITAEQIDAALLGKPLTLLDVDEQAGCSLSSYTLQAEVPNSAKSPGLRDPLAVDKYAKACVGIIGEMLIKA